MAQDDVYNTAITPEEAASVAHLSDQVSPEEAQSVAPSATMGALEAAGHGAASGLTLGFNDELLGAGGAGLDLLRGKTDLDHIVEAYKTHRDAVRASDQAAQSQHPYSYLAGQLGGGMLPTLATAGAGGAVEGASALGNVARAAGTGALIGGVSGVGLSNKEGLNSLQDAPKNALAGAVTGGVLSGAGQALKSGVSKLGESGFGQSLQDAYQAGKGGQSLLNSADTAAVGNKVNTFAEDTANALDQQKQSAGKIIGKGIQDATDQGNKVDIQQGIQQLADDAASGVSANTPDTQRVKSLLDGLVDVSDGGITPEKAQFYKKLLDNELDYKEGAPVINSEAEHLLLQARGLIEDKLKSVLPDEVANAYDVYGGISNVQKASVNGDLQQEMIGIMKNMGKMSDPANQQNVTDFFDRVGKEISPEFADQLRTQMGQNSQRLQTAQVASTDPLGGFWNKLGGSVLGAPVKGANLAGLAVNGVNTTANNVANAAPARLGAMADDLLSSPLVEKSGKALGGILKQAATAEDPAKRRAVMFSIMQNPVYRDILGLNNKEQQ